MRSLSESRYANLDELTERVAIVYQTVTLNERGNPVRSADIVRANVWAKVTTVSAQSALANGQLTANLVYRIVVRHRTDVQPNDQVLWRGRRLELLNPARDLDDRHVWTALDCREVGEHGA